MGVGGGTVAAHIRRRGRSVAVWSRLDETLHGPDEYCLLSNLLGDAKVMAYVFLGRVRGRGGGRLGPGPSTSSSWAAARAASGPRSRPPRRGRASPSSSGPPTSAGPA